MKKEYILYVFMAVVLLIIVMYVFKEQKPTGAEMAGGKMPQPLPQPTPQPTPAPIPNLGGAGLNMDKQLNIGDNGAEVKELQKQLIAKGYNPKGIDGVYGANTSKAHNDFLADVKSVDRSLKFITNWQKDLSATSASTLSNIAFVTNPFSWFYSLIN